MPGEKLLRVAQVKPDIGLRDAQTCQQRDLQRDNRKPQDRKGEKVAALHLGCFPDWRVRRRVSRSRGFGFNQRISHHLTSGSRVTGIYSVEGLLLPARNNIDLRE